MKIQKPNETHQKFLADLSYALFERLDSKGRLTKAAELSVLGFCDWIAIGIVDNDCCLRRQVVVHVDPKQADHAETLCLKYPTLKSLPNETIFLPSVNDETLRKYYFSEDQITLMKLMGMASLIIVPLAARGKVFGSMTFVSAQKQFAKDDVYYAEEITRTVGLSVDNTKLFEEAQKAIRIRDEVLAVVSHDLKNPLSAIQLTTQVFQRKFQITNDATIPTAQIQKMMQSIERATTRAILLITDLLDFSKVTSGKLEVVLKPVPVGQLISESVDFLKILALERSLDLNWETQSTDLEVQCELGRIQQVLSNLIGNAIKFTPPGGKINVKAEKLQNEMIFSVRDTGPGIHQQDIPHLFERYWQAKETKQFGSGLGLAICKGIIDAHHGRIWAESEFGHGSVFYFTLPLVELSQ